MKIHPFSQKPDIFVPPLQYAVYGKLKKKWSK